LIPSRGIISEDERKVVFYTDWFIDFLSSFEESKDLNSETALLGFFSFLDKICSSEIRRKIITRLFVVRASCALMLQRDLGIPQASLYRELNNLIQMRIIEQVAPRRNGKGRPYSIYGIRGHTTPRT